MEKANEIHALLNTRNAGFHPPAIPVTPRERHPWAKMAPRPISLPRIGLIRGSCFPITAAVAIASSDCHFKPVLKLTAQSSPTDKSCQNPDRMSIWLPPSLAVLGRRQRHRSNRYYGAHSTPEPGLSISEWSFPRCSGTVCTCRRPRSQ